MLLMIEDPEEKFAAQEMLEHSIRARLAEQGTWNIGFPSGNVDLVIYANGSGKLWATFGTANDKAIPRYLNTFGVFDPKRHAQIITVEINIPITSNSARVAGFFAKDSATDRVYLMHDGGVGGGKAGVGRSAFLAWTKTTLEDVCSDDGNIRPGIVVGGIDSDDFVARLWHFVCLVKNFKDAVGHGELNDAKMRKAIAEWENFNSESTGRRLGRRRSHIDYMSYHGEVVEHLYKERRKRCCDVEFVLNSRLIDLYVRKGDLMTEIYEVKTSLDRQSIYTAIGQLISHSVGASPDIIRTLVVPEGKISEDLERCLKSLSIRLRRFTITPGKKPKVVLL